MFTLSSLFIFIYSGLGLIINNISQIVLAKSKLEIKDEKIIINENIKNKSQHKNKRKSVVINNIKRNSEILQTKN